MRSAVVGVIGHVDHGKTALVRLLTGADTDRLAEEKRRGISIVLGFAVLRTGDALIDLVDMPGHERFVRTMISGVTGVDGVLVVVAANEGIRPQTREHLDIARLTGMRRGVVALTKADLASPEDIARLRDTIRSQLRTRGFDPMPVIACSAVTGEGREKLTRALQALAMRAQPSAGCGFFYLPVDRAFAVPGFGPVVTGTLRGSELSLGDEVEIVPAGLRARVRSLQNFGEAVRNALPGRRTAVALRGVELGDLPRGSALATPGAIPRCTMLDATIRVLESAPAATFRNGRELRLLFGTTEVGARLRLLDRNALESGETCIAQLRCAEEVAVPAREPFILRLASPPTTVAGGTVLEPGARRRRRGPVPAYLAHLASGRMHEAVESMLERAACTGLRLGDVVRVLGVCPEQAGFFLPPSAVRLAGGMILSEGAWCEVKQAILTGLSELHRSRPMRPGHPREALRKEGQAPVAVCDAVVNRLAAAGELVSERGLFRLRDFDPAALPFSASHLAAEIEHVFLEAGLAPPDTDAVTGGDQRKCEALRWLLRTGVLLRTVDRVQQREIVFHSRAVQGAVDVLRERLDRAEGFLAREAGAVWGVSRKYSIPLLEHLDTISVTRREGHLRFVTADCVEGEEERVRH